MKIILSGGGTGGHIYPALTILKTIKKLNDKAEFLYVGTAKGLEADIVPREGINFTTLDIAGFKRAITAENVKIFGKAVNAVYQARKIIKKYKPDVVVGTGGYVCGPILLAAALQGIPTLIQEQNAIPGVTNKFLGRFVDKIATGYEGAMAYFPANKTIFTGNPIRPEFFSKEEKQEGLSGEANKAQIVLVSGGSRGAHTINEAMLDVHEKFYGDSAVKIIHATGQLEYQFVIDGLKQRNIELTDDDNIKIYPYLYDMPEMLNKADLCIFRAGASSLAEIAAMGVPAILIPYPFAAANHQEKNAREFEKFGAAKVILNKDLEGKVLAEKIADLLHNPQQLKGMANASKLLSKPKAAEEIAKLILDMVNKN